MPFYFALPRSGFTSIQGRQDTGRTDYVRTAPTSLTFTTHAPIVRTHLLLRESLHAVAMSEMAGEKSGVYDKAFRVNSPARSLYSLVAPASVVRLSLPKMSFRFQELSENQENRLYELNMEERSVKGKGRVWVGQIDTSSAAEVVAFGTVQDYASMGGTVSVRGVSALNAIVRILTLGAQTLTAVNDTTLETGVGVIEYTGKSVTTQVHDYQVSDMQEVNQETCQKGIAVMYKLPTSSVLVRKPFSRIWGGVESLSAIVSHGIFCPFEPNYSQTDRRAINVLLSDFVSLCTEPEDFEFFEKELVEMWSREICLTMEGEFIAHMIACLSLAKRIGASVYYLVTGSLYEGVILYGTSKLSFKLVGGRTYESMEKDDLMEDISRYAFHTTTLSEVLLEAGFGQDEISAASVKSMRQLRSVVLGRLGQAVTPQIEASIGKKLLFLNFRERQEPVNPATIAKFVSYIHPTAPASIPDSIYLDRRAFFAKDNTVVALSMFGLYAPSPIISGQTLALAVPPNSNKNTSKEPNAIQFAKKELLVSARDWDGFSRGGAIVQPTNKIKRGVRFSGAEKTEIWGLLTGFAGAGMSAKRSEGQATKRDREADKRDRDGDRTEQASKRAIGMTKVDFSMFESSMAE